MKKKNNILSPKHLRPHQMADFTKDSLIAEIKSEQMKWKQLQLQQENPQNNDKLKTFRKGFLHKQSKNSSIKQLETINYEKYEIERRTRHEKKKGPKNPYHKKVVLYLDGSIAPVSSHRVAKNSVICKIDSQNTTSNENSNIVNYSPNKPSSKSIESRKKFKQFILEEIEKRNLHNAKLQAESSIEERVKRTITPIAMTKKNLFGVKKLEPFKRQKQSDVKMKIQLLNQKESKQIEEKDRDDSKRQSINKIMSKNFTKIAKDDNKPPSNFTDRNFNQTAKNKALLRKVNNNSSISKISKAKSFCIEPSNRLPSVEKKRKQPKRPLVSLQQKTLKRIKAESFIVVRIEPSGQNTLVSGSGFKKNVQIASLTKLMTFYTILSICQQYQIDYSTETVQVSQRASEMSGTSACIQQGEVYTLQQLFYGLMLPSGNDASISLAQKGGQILRKYKSYQSQEKKNLKDSIQSDIEGDQQENLKAFLSHMNLTCKNIGMNSSNFTNPHGLPHFQNVSNPLELAILIDALLRQFTDIFRKVISTQKYTFWLKQPLNKIFRQVVWQNTHKLIRRDNFIGGKTGVTATAGPCLATIYESKHGELFIIVLLRTNKLSRRFKQTRWILGNTLKVWNQEKYKEEIKKILKSQKELDSDNSSDEDEFNFAKNDSTEMSKRNKILTFEM